MRNFDSFEEYLRVSDRQNKGLEKPQKMTHIPTGFVTMAEIMEFTKTLPKYETSNYSEIRKSRETAAENRKKIRESKKEIA